MGCSHRLILLAFMGAFGITLGTAAHAQQPQQAPAPSSGAAQAPAPMQAPAPIEPKALGVVRAACKTLADAKTMQFTAVNTYEKAALNGQPLFYATRNLVALQRPDKLRVITPGDGIPDEFYYNGKIMMAYVPSQDLVAIADAPPTIDQMIDVVWDKAAIYFPFSDVIVSNPCGVIDQRMTTAFYVGQSNVVGNVTTDMVALAGEDVQAELWIGAADHLPRMVRVVYPQEPAHALYQTEYSDWHLNDSIDPAAFASARAANGKPMPFAPPGAGQLPPNPAQLSKRP